jgi:transitional endoplasmic reticulum ATPase
VELRVAVGDHLLTHGDAAGALAAYEAGLALVPTHPGALTGAARAAESAGEAAKASAYRLALGSTTVGSEPKPQAQVIHLRPVPDSAEFDPIPTITFADVAGMEEVKRRLTRSVIHPLKNPALHAKYGKQMGGGLLLYGPPGCGKTFIARAVAGEIGARFVNVGLTDVLDMYVGESERKLHELFENARRRSPTVVFFDEADAIGQRRSHLKGSAGRPLVNQLLTELDGFAGRNDGVFCLAATNHPWDVDPALRRPGRFDRMAFVPPPDRPARRRLLELRLAERPVSGALALDQIAEHTEGFSGADLAALVEDAVEYAIERSVETGREQLINDELLMKALAERRPSARPWLEVARNHAIYANEGGVYDELLDHLKKLGLA